MSSKSTSKYKGSCSTVCLKMTDTEEPPVPEVERFQIMELPIEVRAKIFQMLSQSHVPALRLVCCQWRREIDQFYEFAVNVYDSEAKLDKFRHLRCRECIIWKLTKNYNPQDYSFLEHPGYLKTIKVYGPIHAQALQKLISSAINLEHLTVTRRANYPWILNAALTPELAHLTRLKYLRLNSEEHIILALQTNPVDQLSKPLPMMDCFFPALKHFEILKRFPSWKSTAFVTNILQFVSRHSSTLRTLELDLIPLSSIPYPTSDTDESMGEGDEGAGDEQIPAVRPQVEIVADLNPGQIDLSSLCRLRLERCCVTTKGNTRDVQIWKAILENQSILKELRFDWLCQDPRVEVRARVTGFPWIFFRDPILKCAETLVTVELASLSMMAKDNGTGVPNHSHILPFDLRIFRSCSKLKNLILRCRESHGRVRPEEEQGDEDFPRPEPEEVLLMINGNDLPESIETLEVQSFPMLTTDIQDIIQRCSLLRKLFLKECGKTGNMGVSADTIKQMARLVNLKFLEVIGFNDSTPESRQELELVFQALGTPYEGQETWLEYDNGNLAAHEALGRLDEHVLA